MARIALVVAMLLATGTAAPAQMPAGPSSLQETYGDWTVACITQEAVRRCAMGQRLLQPDGRQVAAIEFSLADEGMSGLLVLPFGLALERGVVVAVDGAPLAPARFSTCLPGGCLVALSVMPDATSRLDAGADFEIEAIANDSSDRVRFTLPLAGFTEALERLKQLATP